MVQVVTGNPRAGVLLSKCLVACNVYVSAGSLPYRDFLMQLLEDTQEHCRQSNQAMSANNEPQNSSRVALVHACADGPYDRSSFHIAGSPSLVSTVASRLATQAVKSLTTQQEATASLGTNMETAHPTVGLVDHVSILPLAHNDEEQSVSFEQWCDYHDNNSSIVKNATASSETAISGWVAREVGLALQAVGVQVYLYGHAHEHNFPLATVRRERTKFFKSLPTTQENNRGGQATVGAPTYFVENYNVRLKSDCPRKVALSLTKHLREKDGGLKFVEALTLPYSENRFEAACNLLNPDVTSSEDIDAKVKEWTKIHGDVVETGYRVGTTAVQCMDALDQVATSLGEKDYNTQLRNRFESYFAA